MCLFMCKCICISNLYTHPAMSSRLAGSLASSSSVTLPPWASFDAVGCAGLSWPSWDAVEIAEVTG